MLLEFLPTWVVMMMMMMMKTMVVAIQRLLLATSQGRGTFSDPTDRQTQTQHFFTLFFY